MSTNSEVMTLIESSKFFLSRYCYLGIKVRKNGLEKEFCDCLIDFKDYYIAIQIKERDISASEDKDDVWYEKKVIKKAKLQIKDTIEFLNDDNNIFYNSNEEIKLENKEIIPLIVFDNERIKKYKRVIYSKSIDMNINLFSLNDFKIMLDTIKIPYDIVNYLKYRERLILNPELNEEMIFEDIDNNIGFIDRIYDEKSLANHYIARTYLQEMGEESFIEYYNFILRQVNDIKHPMSDTLLKILLSVDHSLAQKVVKKWCNVVDRCSLEGLYRPECLILDNDAILMYSNNNQYSKEEFENFIKNYTALCAYKYKVNNMNILVFNRENDKYRIDFFHHKFDLKENEELDKRIKLI